MSDTREKLIELIKQGANGHTFMPTERIADYLIAHGVTIFPPNNTVTAKFPGNSVMGTLEVFGKTFEVYLSRMEGHAVGGGRNLHGECSTPMTMCHRFTLIER